MQEITVELAVGDVLLIGTRAVTVIDIDGPHVCFRIDEAAEPTSPVSAPLVLPAFRHRAK